VVVVAVVAVVVVVAVSLVVLVLVLAATISAAAVAGAAVLFAFCNTPTGYRWRSPVSKLVPRAAAGAEETGAGNPLLTSPLETAAGGLGYMDAADVCGDTVGGRLWAVV
jgi:hypothetical protein